MTDRTGSSLRRVASSSISPARLLRALEPVLLALLLPLILTISPHTVWLLLILPLLWVVRRLVAGRFVPATPLNASLTLLLLMVLVSLWATFDITISLPHVAGLLYGVVLYFAVVSFARLSPRHFHAALAAYIGLGLAIAAVALLTTQWKRELPLLGAIPQYLPASRNSVNPNYLAGALLLILPVPLTLTAAFPTYARSLRQDHGVRRSVLLLLFLLPASLFILFILLLSQSLSGLAAFAITLLFITPILLRPHLRRLGLFLLPSALFLLLSTLFLLPSSLFPLSTTSLGLDTRIEIWQRAIYGMQDFPFTGMGMNTFERVAHVLYPLFTISPTTQFGHAHNHLLQAAVDLGIPGLIAYLALWLGAAAMLLRAWQQASGPWQRALTLGFAAALLAHFTWGLAEAIPLGGRPGFILWHLLALITTLPQRT